MADKTLSAVLSYVIYKFVCYIGEKGKQRWINQFMSFLDYMEHNGKIGHSCRVGFFADGDGDFRPTFTTDMNWEREKAPMTMHTDKNYELECGIRKYNEVTFDAG